MLNNLGYLGIILLVVLPAGLGGAVQGLRQMFFLLAMYAVLFLWIYDQRNHERQPKQWKFMDFLWILWVLWAICSITVSKYFYSSLLALVLILGYLGIYFAASSLNSSQRKKILYIVASAGAFYTCWGGLQLVNLLPHWWWNPSGRLAGLFINHNHFAGFLEMAVFPCAGLLMSKNTKTTVKPYLVSCLILISAALVLTQSRGAWISLCISIIVFCTILSRQGLLKLRPFLIFTGVLIAVAAVCFVIIYPHLPLLDPAAIRQDSSFQTRLLIWERTRDMICAHPIMGSGIGSFPWAFDRIAGMPVFATAAHNDYLQFAAEMGVFSPILFLIISGYAVWLGFSEALDPPVMAGCAASLLSISLHGFVDFNFQIPSNMFLYTLYVSFVSQKESKNGGSHD